LRIGLGPGLAALDANHRHALLPGVTGSVKCAIVRSHDTVEARELSMYLA